MLRNAVVVCLLALAGWWLTGQANAGWMELNTTSVDPRFLVFSGTVNDTGDELLEFAETTGFSVIATLAGLFATYSKSAASVPEPGTLSLLSAGVIALVLMRRRKSA